MGTVANSISPTSYEGLKGTRKVTLVMPSLRVARSLNQMSDNIMILIEGLWSWGIEIRVLNYVSWKLGYFHPSNAFRRDQMST